MCGIIGVVGRDQDTLDTLLAGLRKLEYRGYDSAGVAVTGSDLQYYKTAGEIDELTEDLSEKNLEGTPGIGHTRWSTHGPPTDDNAHPHLDCSETVAVVHNGIIENYQSLRDELVADGHAFRSDTDTEVIPHLIEIALSDGADPEDAFRTAIDTLEGSFAIAAIFEGVSAIFAARNDSPLVVGIGGQPDETELASVGTGPFYLASDIPAFREQTANVVYVEDGQFVRLGDTFELSNRAGELVEAEIHTVEWEPEDTGKSGYEHFMLKEIYEQPRALRQCLSGRVDELDATVDIGDVGDLSPTGVQFVAAGTSYHACLYGAQLFQQADIPAQPFYSHEYANSPPPIGNGLVVAVTQSGETADTLSALRAANNRGGRTLAVTNTVGSTADREADHTLLIRSGPEIGVAATKTFAGQLTALNLLSLATVESQTTRREQLPGLRNLPGNVQEILDDSRAEAVAETFIDADAFFFIGRGLQYSVALEGALKLKEISYRHAEGFAAGELKHGPLALVESNTPVVALVTGDGESARKTIGNIKEVEARDAPVIVVTDGASDASLYADAVLEVPKTSDRFAPILCNVQLQLLAYHVARDLGRSIDKPRNLAKSVTVE